MHAQHLNGDKGKEEERHSGKEGRRGGRKGGRRGRQHVHICRTVTMGGFFYMSWSMEA